jgi:hypothetical protein
MNAQENKEFVRKYFEALSGKPKPPELVDQFVVEQLLKDHIAMYGLTGNCRAFAFFEVCDELSDQFLAPGKVCGWLRELVQREIDLSFGSNIDDIVMSQNDNAPTLPPTSMLPTSIFGCAADLFSFFDLFKDFFAMCHLPLILI